MKLKHQLKFGVQHLAMMPDQRPRLGGKPSRASPSETEIEDFKRAVKVQQEVFNKAKAKRERKANAKISRDQGRQHCTQD